MPTDGPKRLNLALPERTIARIEKIKDATMSSSYTDVIRTALLTYEALVEFASDGDKFFVKKGGSGTLEPVNFLFDVEVRASA